jgi:hypothetical protein
MPSLTLSFTHCHPIRIVIRFTLYCFTYCHPIRIVIPFTHVIPFITSSMPSLALPFAHCHPIRIVIFITFLNAFTRMPSLALPSLIVIPFALSFSLLPHCLQSHCRHSLSSHSHCHSHYFFPSLALPSLIVIQFALSFSLLPQCLHSHSVAHCHPIRIVILITSSLPSRALPSLIVIPFALSFSLLLQCLHSHCRRSLSSHSHCHSHYFLTAFTRTAVAHCHPIRIVILITSSVPSLALPSLIVIPFALSFSLLPHCLHSHCRRSLSSNSHCHSHYFFNAFTRTAIHSLSSHWKV